MTDLHDLFGRFRQLATVLAAPHRLDDERGEWLALVHLGVSLVRDGVAPGELPMLDQLARILGDAEIVEAATGVAGVVGFDAADGSEQAALALFTAVAARAPDVAGVHVALARSWEAMGDVCAMERSLQRALRLDPDHVGAHGDLGELAALRGEFRTAAGHFERAGRPPMGLSAVAANIGSGPVRAGRNEPCPCGSGARFKRCCLGTDGWPLDARIELLPARLADWVHRPVWLRRRLSFAAAVAGVDDITHGLDRVVDVALTPGTADLHLFDGGGIRRLADEIAPVLRADERDVLARWVDCHHDLYEVLDERRFVHVPTGEIRQVTGFDGELLEGTGSLVLAVLVPTVPIARRPWVLGGEPIPLDDEQVDELRAIAATNHDPIAVARVAITPGIEFAQAVRGVTPGRDPQRDARLRWLFGDRIDPACVRDIADVDDLVTTIHMSGGGFSAVGEYIRWTARQIAEGEPPEVWAMAQELSAAGHDRETVLVHLACAWYAATLEGPDPDAIRATHLDWLRSLP